MSKSREQSNSSQKGTNCQKQQTLAWLAEKHLIDENHY